MVGERDNVAHSTKNERDDVNILKRTPVAEEHLSVFHEALEDAHDLRGRLVGLVDDKAAAVLHGRHEGAVVPLDYAVFKSWRESQRLDGGVSVQLNVLSLEA